MDSPRGSSVLPLRPLTVGELLDAAVGLLRGNARALLSVAFGLALVEQALLYPLRELAGVRFPTHLGPYSDRLAEYWLMLGGGYVTEAAVIALLGGLAARAAVAAVGGGTLSTRALLSPRDGRPGAVLVAALLAAVVCGVAALACWVPWILGYGLVGLVVPAVVIDGRGPFRALGRSFSLSARDGMRACWIRFVGYLGWLAIRTALGFGGIAALDLVLPGGDGWLRLSAVAAWTAVNTVAYATLACLDATLHLETRMRTEGLDIVAFRARRRGRPVPLEVPR